MAATMNMFSALDSDDDDVPVQNQTQEVKNEKADKAPSNDNRGKGKGRGKGNRSKGKGKGRGKGDRGDREWTPRNPNRDYSNEEGDEGGSKGKSARDSNRRNRSKGKGTGRGRGGGREYDRRDGTGRGREGAKKDGAGRGNWGSNEDTIAEGQAEVAEGENVAVDVNEGGDENADAAGWEDKDGTEEAPVEEVDDSVGLDDYFNTIKLQDNTEKIRKVETSSFENAKTVRKGEEEDFLKLGSGKKKNSRQRKAGNSIFEGVGFRPPPVQDDSYDRKGKGKGKGDRKGKGKGKGDRKGKSRGDRNGYNATPNLNDAEAFPTLGK